MVARVQRRRPLARDGRGLRLRLSPLQLWDVRRRTLVSTALLSPSTAYATDVAFSPDGTKLAAAANDGNGTAAIEIFSVPRLAQLKTLRADAGTSVQFSPDGRLLAFGDLQGRVWLYDTHTWTPRGRPLVAHTSAVVTVSFSPDGRTLATTSDDGTTRLWDVPSGRPIGTALPGLAQHYVAAAFVDGGTHLVTLDDNGRGYLWDIQPQSWARRACQIAGRTLTRTRMERRAARAHLRPRVRTPLTARRGSARHTTPRVSATISEQTHGSMEHRHSRVPVRTSGAPKSRLMWLTAPGYTRRIGVDAQYLAMNSIFVQLGERDRMAPPRAIEKLSTLAPHASGLMSVRDDVALADTRPTHRQSISLNDHSMTAALSRSESCRRRDRRLWHARCGRQALV